MKTALITLAIISILGGPAFGQTFEKLFSGPNSNGYYYAVMDNGDLFGFSVVPGAPAHYASFGPGPWADFDCPPGGPIMALKPNGEIWEIPFGPIQYPSLRTTLPGEGEYCAFGYECQYALTCSGEVYGTHDGQYIGMFTGVVDSQNVPWGNVKATYR